MRKVTWLLALGMATAIAGVPPAYAQSSKQVAQSAKPDSKTSATSSGAASGAQPSLLGQYGDWGAYTANPNGRKICFALSKPQKATTDPPNRPRDPAYMFISTRPAEKVTNEVSIVVGYGQKANSEAMVDIGGTKFAMYTQNDGAWIKNAAEEPRLVEALRKGADVVVHGESARGTKTTDTYSLKGLTQALERVSQECK